MASGVSDKGSDGWVARLILKNFKVQLNENIVNKNPTAKIVNIYLISCPVI
jgi:hypothetical protein